ncbi:MAG: Asp-tRNA(Asn)/Glu-tRNA(Gln) amidotransferase GatCAB subunit A [Gemmatimonadetes bacterium]|nr:Asp-tRNA(Asn)/Glu-tRNA(Gln) amidotransferase GatCAB subunit A [Gemmatimonadota bacterium]
MPDTPLHYQTITRIADRIRSGELTSVTITRSILDRISALDGQLKSYVTVMADHALSQAEQADRELASGQDRGPLHGIPIAVKDLCFTTGVATMGGSQALADHIPDFDGTVVTKLAEAGSVLLGKLNLTEGAMGGYNPKFDAPVNPWNPDRWAGASSSGSGVATAAGLCFGSLGSDTGGSIRFPAAACGTVGLKPTWGRVSRYGVLALAESLDHVGPLTRSVADAGTMLEAIAGQDPNDPTSLPDPVPDMLEGLVDGLTEIRFGFDEQYASEGIDEELVKAVGGAVGLLKDLGADIRDIGLPDMDALVAAWPALCSSEAVAAHRETYPGRRDDYGPWFRGWLDMGAGISAAEYAEANQIRLESNGHLRRIFHDIDVLICPSMSGPAHPITRDILYGPPPFADNAPPEAARPANFQRFTAPFDFNGAPTLSVPCGLTQNSLPLSLQFVGRHLSEPLLCRVGHAYEQATDWHLRHPEI